tara:strand:+ start:840 stop:944 length:105 start_codon:yes stop_codon:yes gene_type:complete
MNQYNTKTVGSVGGIYLSHASKEEERAPHSEELT